MTHPSASNLRDEIAAVAARLIAEDGMDYAGAKRRAVREIVGGDGRSLPADLLPDNAHVEEAVRAHQALFMGDAQPARLLSLRRTALDAMTALDEFRPFLVGAVFNGTAGEHSDIQLQVVSDNPKDLEIFLLNAGIDFDVGEGRGDVGETLHFLWPPRTSVPRRAGAVATETVHLSVIDPRDIRSPKAGRAPERADRATVEALIAESDA